MKKRSPSDENFFMLLLLGLVRLFQLGCYCHPQQQDSRIEWITIVDDTSQCYVDMPIDHFDKGPTLRFLVRKIRKGNPGRHLWILPEVLGEGIKETHAFLNNFEDSLPFDTWCYILEPRTGFEGLPPQAYSLQNSAMDIIEASRILNITNDVYLLGDGFGSTLAYMTLKQAPDFFTGALLINFVPSLGVHDNFELDIMGHLKKLCRRDQECQSLLYELDKWHSLSSEASDMSYCARSIESVVDHIMPFTQTDPRAFLRKAALLLGRAFPNQPQNILIMYVLIELCPNVKTLSRFFNEAKPAIPAGRINEQLKWLNEKTKYSPKPTRAVQIVLKSEQSNSNQLCHENAQTYTKNIISNCDSILELPSDIPTYDRVILGPLKTKSTRILILSGALNFDALPDRAKPELELIECPSKQHLVLDNHGYSLLHTVPPPFKDSIFLSHFFHDEKSNNTLKELFEEENVKPLSWLVRVNFFKDPLHIITYPDASNWFLWMTCVIVLITIPLLHFIYIYIIYY